jgi:autotransporter-associated beta strand protein
MNPNRFFPINFVLCAVITLLWAGQTQAEILGPYPVDANTLHLWHLDEAAVPSADGVVAGTNCVGLLNGATLGTPSYSGFGNAVNTVDGGQDSGTTAGTRDALITPSTATPPGNIVFNYVNPTNGAFTFEAIVWIGFDPTKNLGPITDFGNGNGPGTGRDSPLEILSCESTVNGSRIFQFRIMPKGSRIVTAAPVITATNGPYLTFENVRMVSGNQATIYAPIPMSGPDAIVSNQWYHVAVTYNGISNTVNNIKFYWTLLDPSRIVANQIAITSGQATLNGPNPIGPATTPPVIGNEARARTGNFIGMLDEVRVSSIARAANDMMFGQNNPIVLTPPASQIVGLGQSAPFNVVAAGKEPLSYQWRHEGTNIAGATQTSYTILGAQLADAGGYTVVVSNNFNSVTSVVATLNVRTPLDLTWLGTAGSDWNTSLVNWDTDGNNVADAAFSPGDNVILDNSGSGAPLINLTNVVTPSAVTVSASSDYTLSTTGTGGIGNNSRILKSGTGTFVIDTDNTFNGPTIIQGGILQVGTGLPRGSLGNGSVTNNSALVIYRSGTVNFNSFLVGTGSLTNNATNTVNVTGTNTLSGSIVLNAGVLNLSGPSAKGNSTNIVLNATANASPTRLNLAGGISFGATETISLLGTTASPDYRCSISSGGGTNVLNGPLILGGDGTVQFNSDSAGGELDINTALINSPGFVGKMILRGNFGGRVTSQINIGGHVSKTDGGTWVISSTGNSWTNTDVANGTLRMGASGVFPPTTSLNMTTVNGLLDLAGYNQHVGLLTGPGVIGSSSTVADCTLAVSPPAPSLFSGVIQNSLSGGTRKLGLTIVDGTLTLSGTNTYSGTTTISAGGLELFGTGSISNSAAIVVTDGAVLDATLRSDATVVINANQTLTANGAAIVQPNLVNGGSIELRLSKNGTTLTNDSLNGLSTITYGGTLKLGITASPALTTSDTFKLFNSASYSGAFLALVPSAPALDLAWDTSTLATDGTLRIITGSSLPPTNMSFQVTGNQLEISWPANYTGWRLQGQTNGLNTGLSSNWGDIALSGATNRVFAPIDPANGTVFYRLIYP